MNTNVVIGTVLGIVVGAAAMFFLQTGHIYEGWSDGGVPRPGTICTQEAKLCPDGSSVGRGGPNCEFAECPSTTGTGTLRGQVTLSPTCPVETTPPNPACAPKPYQTTVTITGGKGPYSAQTDTKGYYSIKVPPGSYTVSAMGSTPNPLCKSVSATVTTNAVNTLNLSCDTGIR